MKKSHFTIMVANSRGQSILELLLFTPFVLSLYFFLFSLGASINGSINQQKIARAYFFSRLKNNSMMPKSRYGESYSLYQNFQSFVSFDYIGWADHLEGGKSPVSACYRVDIPFNVSAESSCDAYSETKTKYVRVQTIFGACGVTVVKSKNQLIPVYYSGEDSDSIYGACSNK